MHRREENLISDSEYMLNLIENSSLQLTTKLLIKRMTEVINDMHKVIDKAPDYQEERVAENLARAYWHRADCYVDENKWQEAFDDYQDLSKLKPGVKEVLEKLARCQKELKRAKQNIHPRQSTMYSPEAKRPEGVDTSAPANAPKGMRKQLGGHPNSAFKHHGIQNISTRGSHQRPSTPANHHLNQPGGKRGIK